MPRRATRQHQARQEGEGEGRRGREPAWRFRRKAGWVWLVWVIWVVLEGPWSGTWLGDVGRGEWPSGEGLGCGLWMSGFA